MLYLTLMPSSSRLRINKFPMRELPTQFDGEALQPFFDLPKMIVFKQCSQFI